MPRSAARTPSSSKLATSRERRARLSQRLHAALVQPALARRCAPSELAGGPRRKKKPASGQKSASVWIFSWLIAAARSSLSRSSPRASSGPSLARYCGEALARARAGVQLADVEAVHPAQLRLVELRGVATDALEREALRELRGGHHGRVVAGAPAEQREVVAHGLRQVARGRAARPPRRRRGAWRASCRRGRAAAAGARRAAAARPVPRAPAAAWACSRGGPRRAPRA